MGDNVDGAKIISPVNNLHDVVVDSNGPLNIADNNHIRKITWAGVINILAGNGNRGYLDTIRSAAEFSPVQGIAADSKGNSYVADRDNKCPESFASWKGTNK